MEFFEWMGITQSIYGFIADLTMQDQTLALVKRSALLAIIAGLIAGAALFALCLVLGGLGLYKMAKKKGKKHAWLAFIPFANTYYTGLVAGEARFFGQKMKRAGLYAMLAEILYVGLNVIVLVADILMIPYYIGTNVPTYDGGTYVSFGPTLNSVPPALRWLYNAVYANSGFGWANLLTYAVLLVYLVFLAVTLAALFKQFSPRSYTGLMVLCIFFPVRGFVFFSLRDRTPVDYDEYMRRRMEEYARRQQQYGPYGPYGPYTGPYGQPPYSRPPYDAQQPPQQQEPFSDFGGGTQNGHSGQNGQNGQNGPTPPPSDDGPFSDF